MEILLLIVIGFACKGAWDHVKKSYGSSRDQRIKEVAKTYPKGALPKSKRKAAARRHAAGWWGGEVARGFPVTRTGWHAAWLAHEAESHAHHARREDARADATEAEVARKLGVSGARQRRAAAQAELDKIEEELAAQEAKGSPATGRKAVREAADEVARKRAQKEQPSAGKCPACGAPDGYDHLEGCDPSAPPLPADSVRRTDPVVIDTPVRLHNAEDSQWLGPGEARCEGCGGSGRNDAGDDACPACRGWGGAPANPDGPQAPPGTICRACGRPGTREDPVVQALGGEIHRSHALARHEAYADALKKLYPDDGEIDDAVIGADHCFEGEHDTHPSELPGGPMVQREANGYHPSPTTQGAPVTADTNYTTVLTNAKGFAAQADEDAVTARSRRMLAEHHLEEMQAAEVDAATLSSQMDLVEKLRASEEAQQAIGEHATQVSDGLQQRHGGLKQAHDDAPVRAAVRDFYEGS